MNTSNKVSVLGGGSFGTVLANLAASNGYQVSLWVSDSEQALRIKSEWANTSYHPDYKAPENILASYYPVFLLEHVFSLPLFVLQFNYCKALMIE